MICSKCGSSNCKSFDMLHQSGTSVMTHTELSGSVHSQTVLAKQCEPPSNYLITAGIYLGVVLGLFALPVGCMKSTMTGGSFPGNVGYGLVAGLISAALVAALFVAISHFTGWSSRHSRKMREWENSTMCVDCGNVVVNG